MASHLTDVADAVVDVLNAATFSEPHPGVFAERRYRPRKDFEEMGDKVYVTVVPRASSATNITRGKTKERDVTVDIGIERVTNFEKNDDGDALVLLVQEIEDLFLGQAAVIESSLDPPYFQERIDTMNTFTAIIRLTFKNITA